MKRLFILSFLFITGLYTHAQIKVHSHTHSWAGGVCCSGGSDYTLTIKIPKGEWQQFDSLLVCSETGKYSYGVKQLNPTMVNDTLVVTVKYSYYYNRTAKDYDLFETRKPISCNGYLSLQKGYVRKELSITSESESMTAYP